MQKSLIILAIVSKLEMIGDKIEEEDVALRLIWSLPSSYELIKPVLMYGKKTLTVNEVACKIYFEERRMKSDENMSTNSIITVRSETHVNKNYKKKVIYWKCGKSRHLKKNCPNGGTSWKDSHI